MSLLIYAGGGHYRYKSGREGQVHLDSGSKLDVYSFAMVLWVLFSRERPYLAQVSDGLSVLELLDMVYIILVTSCT